MGAISLRLPEPLEARLAAEAEAEGRSRSDVAREAIADYLERRERDRFMAELVEELRQGYADPRLRREASELAEMNLDEAIDAIVESERAAGIDPDERWWR